MARLRHFFHGTNADLEIGDHILPSSEAGVPQANPRAWAMPGSKYDPTRLAHATTDERVAWEFADRTAHRASRGYGADRSGPPLAGGGRARVYTVEPVGKAEMGLENPRHPRYNFTNSREWVAPKFKVTGRIDIQPPMHKSALYFDHPRLEHQGTLPVDFSTPGRGNSWANHPQPNQELRAAQLQEPSPGQQAVLNMPQFAEHMPGQTELFKKPRGAASGRPPRKKKAAA